MEICVCLRADLRVFCWPKTSETESEEAGRRSERLRAKRRNNLLRRWRSWTAFLGREPSNLQMGLQMKPLIRSKWGNSHFIGELHHNRDAEKRKPHMSSNSLCGCLQCVGCWWSNEGNRGCHSSAGPGPAWSWGELGQQWCGQLSGQEWQKVVSL